MSDIQHKSMALKELSAEGSLAAVISTFQKDRDGDVMTREAFAGSAGKSIPMVWAHNWDQPIGKGIVKVNDDSAEFHGQFNLDTTAGEQAYRTVKAMGDLQQYSIGFRIKDSSWDKKDGESIRTIKDIELFEASPVLVGAAYGTHTIAVKDGEPTDLIDRITALEAKFAELDLEAKFAEISAALASLKASRLDIPDLDTPERKAQLSELEKLLAGVKLEG